MEIWKDIPGFEGRYQASSLGRLRSLDRTIVKRHRTRGSVEVRLSGKVLIVKKCTNNAGYLGIPLGHKNSQMVHRLVAMAFHGKPKSGQVANHKNGIKTDNRAENLEWVNQRRNCLHSRNVLRRRGKKISIESVANIIIESHKGFKTKDIAAKYGLSRQGVSGILTGRFWPNADYPEIETVRRNYPPRVRHKKHVLY